ncbi:MAG TPA: DUF2255 domain-containing protein [Oceanospirillales bacterium]|nr:hypothetical protein [Oceanospirillaceae bacterium]HBS41672.1 DUF2255 domain-containing protein [Oceanospirillales bacterium]|tara:strand:- start:3626 stop:4000 length:375 start_codon:yes stop_codon:yes gene_type:complete
MWNADTINTIDSKDDLHVSPLRADGRTYGTPTRVWCVTLDDALYIRAYSGTSSSWYQAALQHPEGRIRAAGQIFDVRYEPVDPAENDRIDEAYRQKYSSSSYLKPMISTRARAAGMKLVPLNSH